MSPRARGGTETADDVLHECVLPFAYHDDRLGATVVIRSGTKLRASHPAVRDHGMYFVAEGTPHDERPSVSHFVVGHGRQVV